MIFKESTRTNQKSELFFRKCINNELSLHDYGYRKDGTTKLKISILEEVVKINKTATMIGTYNESRPKLVTDKLYGNIRVSVGSVLSSHHYFVPNTVLKEDIRNMVSEWEPIKAIYLKDINETKYIYETPSKLSKDFDSNQFDETINSFFNV